MKRSFLLIITLICGEAFADSILFTPDQMRQQLSISKIIKRPVYVEYCWNESYGGGCTDPADPNSCSNPTTVTHCRDELERYESDLILDAQINFKIKTLSGNPIEQNIVLNYGIPDQIRVNDGHFNDKKIVLGNADKELLLVKRDLRITRVDQSVSVRGEITLTHLTQEELDRAMDIKVFLKRTNDGANLKIVRPSVFKEGSYWSDYTIFRRNIFGTIVNYSADESVGTFSDDREEIMFSVPEFALKPKLNISIRFGLSAEVINNYLPTRTVHAKVGDLLK